MFNHMFQRCMEKGPVSVMVHSLLERVLTPNKLNALRERTAMVPYTRDVIIVPCMGCHGILQAFTKSPHVVLW